MTPDRTDGALRHAPGRTRLWPLATAIAIMIVVTIWPVILATSDGRVDYWAATALFWAMSARFVSGVGFRPRFPPWRWLFSQWSCLIALVFSVLRLLMH